jgi:hypothetical protein
VQVLVFLHQETKRNDIPSRRHSSGLRPGIRSSMEPPRRSLCVVASEVSSAAGSDAEDDRYCSANSALGTPSSIATLLPSSDFWDHQMDLLDDHPATAGFPKKHQLRCLQTLASAQSWPETVSPPATAGVDDLARQGSSPASPYIPPRPRHNQVTLLVLQLITH